MDHADVQATETMQGGHVALGILYLLAAAIALVSSMVLGLLNFVLPSAGAVFAAIVLIALALGQFEKAKKLEPTNT